MEEMSLMGTIKNILLAYFAVAIFSKIHVSSVEIRRLSVPRWIQNGTQESVVLDCEYVYNENDLQLVVKWFFDDNKEPVYQWIPELNSRHTSGVLKNRLDLTFAVYTADAYSRYRAIRIKRPTIELSGKYTCLVASLGGQDSREQVMTVFVPSKDFDVTYAKTSDSSVNVTCDTQDLFPLPVMKLYMATSTNSQPQLLDDVTFSYTMRSSGTYNACAHRTFSASELSKNGATVFECMLELPGTNYGKSKRIAYYPGVQGLRIDAAHSLSSFSMKMTLSWTMMLGLVFVASVLVDLHTEIGWIKL